ncbi:MAG: peptide ABC transporter substrate-binding protein [Acidobacteria bacterium]|nr:MAG: peptide ABC transporter substrate-binding protein [Acidobacteriota bacterium]
MIPIRDKRAVRSYQRPGFLAHRWSRIIGRVRQASSRFARPHRRRSDRAPLGLLNAGLTIGLVALLGTGCQNEGLYYGVVKPPDQPELRIGLGSNPETLDPHRAAGGPEDAILINLFEGLTEYDPETADPIPALAERWDVNREATVYTFYLRHDARWSNGEPVTAEDFVSSWRRILDPATASPNASLLYCIRNAANVNQGKVRLRSRRTGKFLTDERGRALVIAPDDLAHAPRDHRDVEFVPYTPEDIGVEAVDEYTLRVEMEQPTAFFLDLTPHVALRPVPRKALQRWGDQWTRPEHIVTNGPYTLAEWRPADVLILRKNPLYYAAEEVPIQRATFFLADDSTALLNLYRVGTLDVLVTGLLPLPYIPLLRRHGDYVSGPYLMTYFFMLNVNHPPLNKKRVRKALSLGLNRQQLCDRLLQAGQRPAHTLIPSDFGGRYPRPSGPPFDPARADDLMRRAGFPRGRGLRLTLTYNSLDINRRIAEMVQAQWRQVFPELQLELVNLEWQVYLSVMRQRQFDIIRRSWIADYKDPYAFLELMLSESSNNFTGWTDPIYDRLIHLANAIVDPVQRFRQLAEAEKRLIEAQPIIPLYHGVTFFLRKPYVRGWESNVLDKHPLKFVRIERESRNTVIQLR